MQLPVLTPGKRYTLARPHGSADALLLARVAAREAGARRLTAIVCAEPADTQRLEQELAFFDPALRIAVFPDWETLPYDTFSPHQDLISERLATLWRILQARDKGDLDVVLVPAATALARLAPPAFLAAYTFDFKQGEKLDEAGLKAQLTLAGYSHVSQVVSPGEYAVRGGLIDLFPMGSAVPYRVDLFGDEVDSIRTFDPDTQRSLYPVPAVRLLPGREFPLDEAARNAFRARWREKLEGDPSKVRLYKDIGAGLAGGGIEYYLPLFFDATATLFDYFGSETVIALHGEVGDALARFWSDTRERHRFLQHDKERPILAPELEIDDVKLLLAFAGPDKVHVRKAYAGSARPLKALHQSGSGGEQHGVDPVGVRQHGRRIAVGDGAADRAAVADLRVADPGGERRQRRNGASDLGGGGDRGMPRHGADGDRPGADADAGEPGNAGKVDERGRAG